MPMTPSKLLLASLLLTVPQDYPPPFPREGATKVFENESVTVWDVTWKAGVPTPMHQHRLELVGVTLVPGTVRVTLPDGATRVSDVSFNPAAHSEAATSNVQFPQRRGRCLGTV